jgi:2-hydroxy-3-keto-5-methylthiopentenyl-1-phosphate phosphatase
MRKAVLVFDFDNTITIGDVLDEIVEKFSPDEGWKTWEREWVEGRLPAIECLRLQVENLRVTRERLFEHLGSVRIDPAFAGILRWARARQVELFIVSDSFQPLIERILANNSIEGVPVFANGLAFSGEKLVPSFPFHDPAFPRSANAKAKHLAPYSGHTIIFAGDGRSDLDAALASDIVFAKNSLANELATRGKRFHAFKTLKPLAAFLRTLEEGLPRLKKAS